MVSASVPSGASTGENEALELRDGDPSRYSGKGVLKAADAVNDKIAPKLVGMDPVQQRSIDRIMVELDGTDNKSALGANAILGVSIAAAKAAAAACRLPLYEYLGGAGSNVIPVPMMNIVNGGKHAQNNLDLQEFMIMSDPHRFGSGGIKLLCGRQICAREIGPVRRTINGILAAMDAINLCRGQGWGYIISHRSGETEDPFIADFAVAMGGGQIKTGSLTRSERLAKYNRLLEIEQQLGAAALYSAPRRLTGC
jgi:enolase